MSNITEQVSNVMLKALSNNAKKFDCAVTNVIITMGLGRDGELICVVTVGYIGKSSPTLSELIGYMYAAVARGRIKKMLRDLATELGGSASDVQLFIKTPDGKAIEVTAFNDKNGKRTQLSMDQLI